MEKRIILPLNYLCTFPIKVLLSFHRYINSILIIAIIISCNLLKSFQLESANIYSEQIAQAKADKTKERKNPYVLEIKSIAKTKIVQLNNWYSKLVAFSNSFNKELIVTSLCLIFTLNRGNILYMQAIPIKIFKIGNT